MCAGIFAKKIHRALTQSIDARWKMKSPLTARSRGELIAGNHAPWRLWPCGFHQPIYGDTTSTREMKGANKNIPWDIITVYIYIHVWTSTWYGFAWNLVIAIYGLKKKWEMMIWTGRFGKTWPPYGSLASEFMARMAPKPVSIRLRGFHCHVLDSPA